VPPRATPAVEHVAIRKFHQMDPRTGRTTFYLGSGDELYTGSLEYPYLLDPSGPDGQGPLIAEKSAPAAAPGDSNEEK
jgi:hypothetical protein